MKHIFTISLCFLALSLSAQETITYPYNPDGDADGLVAVPDIQDLLAVYGSPFSPAEIMVGDTALSEWIQILYQALQDQQAVIESLMSGADGCNWQFPEGLNGETVIELIHYSNPYIVPDNKHLYVLSRYSSGPALIKVDGYETPFPSGNPLLFSEGQTLSTDPSEQEIGISGILIEALPEVVPILIEITDFIPYQIPQGKKLVVLNITGGDVRLTDSFYFADGGSQSDLPLIISSEFSIETNSNYDGVKLNGYLVDEDYFADCGGGGSGGVSVSTFGDTLTVNGESVIVPGISFPNVVPTFGSVTDASGNTYQTVKYGNEEFMTEDLNSSHWSDGTLIPENCFPGTNTNSMNETPGWCYYNNNSSSAYAYGKLYNGWLVGDSRNACPVGWHISTTQEWEAVLDLFGDYNGSVWEQSGERLKSDILWNGTNESFMSLVPGGQNNNGSGDSGGSYGIYWTGNVTQVSGGNWTMVDLLQVSSNSDNVIRSSGADWGYHAIRCKKN